MDPDLRAYILRAERELMALLALDTGFEYPRRANSFLKPLQGKIRIDPALPIFRENSLLVAPNSGVMRNLAPRMNGGSGPIGDPVIRHNAMGQLVPTRWGLVVPTHAAVNTSHSSWAGIEHSKTTGFTLWAVGVILSGITFAQDFWLYFSGAGGDIITVGATQYTGYYKCQVNFTGPAFSSSAAAPYFANNLRGRVTSVVGRTHSATSHECDAYCPVSDVLQNATDSSNIPGKLDDTTAVTVGYSTTGLRSGVLYAGYWNRVLSDEEVETLLFRPASIFIVD